MRPHHVQPSVLPARSTHRTPGDREHWENIIERHRGGASLSTIASALNRQGLRSPSGARWHRTTVARAVSEAAYPQLTATQE